MLQAHRFAALRHNALAVAAALILAGCGGGSNGAQSVDLGEDFVLGSPDAAVTIIEYASTTCPACNAFHDQVMPELKARYIDPGHAKLIFREMPTSPTSLSVAGMMTARCAGEEQYYDVIDTLFDQRVELIQAFQQGGSGARDRLSQIARAAGMTDAEFEDCIRDEAGIARIQAVADAGRADWGVNSTPSFVINGVKLDTGARVATIDDIAARIDPLVAG